MTIEKHKPVLINEVLTYLDPQPGKTYLDMTFGSGGHTQAILEKEQQCNVIAFDWDEHALETFGQELKGIYGNRLRLVFGNFALLYRLLKKIDVQKVDGILADFGTSQVQIAQRPGLSIFKDTFLDMRMSPSHQKITAADILNEASEDELQEIIFRYGQERWSKRIARAIVNERQKKPIKTTGDLVAIIDVAMPTKPGPIHKATRIFQALRIVVNKELENIQAFLPAAIQVLHPHGRLVCISFHSLEDRLVKQFFKEKEQQGVLTILTPKVVRATQEEIMANISARSARLRAAERIG